MTNVRWLAILLICLGTAGCGGGKRIRAGRTPQIGAWQQGIASWYGHPYHGRRAANGEVYDMEKMTAAHRTLPFDTWVRVRNLENGRTTQVRITDRGPFVRGRIIDLSRAAAREVDMLLAGIVKVRIEVIRPPAHGRQLPAPSAPAPASPQSPAGGRFAVQIAALANYDNAERLRQDMERRHGPARLVMREGQTTLWRVLVGQLSTIEQAEGLAERIRAQDNRFQDAVVVRLDP